MTREESEIRALLEERVQATRAKDTEAAVRPYAHDVVNLTLAPPLAQRGSEATDPEGIRQWFATWDGPIGLEFSEISIRVEDSIVFAFGLVHMSGKRAEGADTDVWARSTVCFEKRGCEWKIVHEQTSFPMRMDGSEKAATGLRP